MNLSDWHVTLTDPAGNTTEHGIAAAHERDASQAMCRLVRFLGEQTEQDPTRYSWTAPIQVPEGKLHDESHRQSHA